MSDNTVLLPGSGGDTLQTKDHTTYKTPVSHIADPTTPTQMAAVSSGGALKVDGSAATQPVSGTVNVGNVPTVDTELSAPSTLADATANPSATAVGTFQHLYNGATWDRVRGDTANGVDVDVTRVGGNVTVVQPTAANLKVDASGVAVPVTDNGGSLTVDGTVAVTGTVSIGNSPTVDTELSAPSTLADATANPSATAVGTFPHVYNGTTWDRMKGAVGDVAHDGVDSGNPVKVGVQARTSDVTAVASADRANLIGTILGKLIVKLDAVPDLTWNYAAAAGGLVTTAGVTAKAAGAAGVRNYVKSCQVVNSHATISTEVLIRDGAAGTVLHRGWAQAGGGGYAHVFDPPLRGSAATLVEIAEITATASTGVLVNLQGYSAAE